MDEKKYNALDFGIKKLETQRFLKNKYLYKARLRRKKFFLKAVFEKTFAHKNSRFHSIYPLKCAIFAFYVQF